MPFATRIRQLRPLIESFEEYEPVGPRACTRIDNEILESLAYCNRHTVTTVARYFDSLNS